MRFVEIGGGFDWNYGNPFGAESRISCQNINNETILHQADGHMIHDLVGCQNALMMNVKLCASMHAWNERVNIDNEIIPSLVTISFSFAAPRALVQTCSEKEESSQKR